MNAIDAELMRDIRREIGKRAMNATRLDVEVTNGRVQFGGTITAMREMPDADLKHEMATLERVFLRDRRVKSLSNTARIIEDESEHEHHDARGRVRH